MNKENLLKLKAWLEDGAPHVVFNMGTALVSFEEIDPEDRADYLSDGVSWVERDKFGVGDCGTMCCIAGAAYQFATGGINSKQVHEQVRKHHDVELEWPTVRDKALKWLGLPNNTNTDYMGHPLFSHELAPHQCTPAEAARAVQNVIDFGEPRWKTVRV